MCLIVSYSFKIGCSKQTVFSKNFAWCKDTEHDKRNILEKDEYDGLSRLLLDHRRYETLL